MKWIAILVALVIAAVVFVATVLIRDKNKPPVIITVLGEDSSNLAAYASLAEDFAERTGISVNFESATFEQALVKADADFRSGMGRYDIVLQYNFSLAPYVRNNYVAATRDVFSPSTLADRELTARLFPNTLLETCYYYRDYGNRSSPPEQFGFPFAANTMLLVYNKTLFDTNQSIKY